MVSHVSGSGPAYLFLLMESMERAGIALGLTKDKRPRLLSFPFLRMALTTRRRALAYNCVARMSLAQGACFEAYFLPKERHRPRGITELAVQCGEIIERGRILLMFFAE